MQPVRPITPVLIPSAARLLAEAFFSNPAHIYLCPNPVVRFRRLEWLLGGNLRAQPDLSTSFCLATDSNVDAMGFWTRSEGPVVSSLDRLRSGALAAPFRLGLGGVRRLLEVTRGVDEQLERALGGRRFWYLNNMAIDEKLRGAGIGTRLLTEQLEVVSKRAPDARIALATQRPENVTFYRRLGFEVVSDETIGQGTDSFRNWIMEVR